VAEPVAPPVEELRAEIESSEPFVKVAMIHLIAAAYEGKLLLPGQLS
jgi:hypothetical protein